jgi:hypothetical protein
MTTTTTEPTVKLRKVTVFMPCEKHAAKMAAETRYRRAEIMVEGGYGGHAPCDCHMRPGTDFFSADFVARHPDGCGIQGR